MNYWAIAQLVLTLLTNPQFTKLVQDLIQLLTQEVVENPEVARLVQAVLKGEDDGTSTA